MSCDISVFWDSVKRTKLIFPEGKTRRKNFVAPDVCGASDPFEVNVVPDVDDDGGAAADAMAEADVDCAGLSMLACLSISTVESN